MKIRWIDAMDAFSHGGYIDLETMHYIAPKWFSDLCPENDTGLSESDYEEIAKAPERYLRVPIFRMCGIRCIAAIEMGMTRDELIRLGMKKKEYWEVFLPANCDGSSICNNEEWNVKKSIDEHMIEHHKFLDFNKRYTQLLDIQISEWLNKYGIQLY